MPSLETYKKILSENGNTVGQVHKKNSDDVIENTWWNDIQSRKCYIYDFFHDDQQEMNYGYDPSKSRLKTAIDAKFIKTQKQTLAKDMIDYQLQFRPSQKVSNFNESDELYYYERDFTKRFGSEFPVGLFCDIEDDNGVFHKWLICQKEYGIQFPKFIILPCNYNFRWVTEKNGERIIRSMWGVSRNQLSYNSGVYRDYIEEHVENQDKCWFPMNEISSELFYTSENNGKYYNLRMIIGAATQHPTTWRISKVENHSPLGLQKVTVYQDKFDASSDYIDWDAINNGDVYAMYANYFSSSGTRPINPISADNIAKSVKCVISTSNAQIKVGGSYKTLTAKFYDFSETDITEEYLKSVFAWKAFIDNKDITDSGLITLRRSNNGNIMKIKFNNDMNYLSKLITVKCESEYDGEVITGEIKLEIVGI